MTNGTDETINLTLSIYSNLKKKQFSLEFFCPTLVRRNRWQKF